MGLTGHTCFFTTGASPGSGRALRDATSQVLFVATSKVGRHHQHEGGLDRGSSDSTIVISLLFPFIPPPILRHVPFSGLGRERWRGPVAPLLIAFWCHLLLPCGLSKKSRIGPSIRCARTARLRGMLNYLLLLYPGPNTVSNALSALGMNEACEVPEK